MVWSVRGDPQPDLRAAATGCSDSVLEYLMDTVVLPFAASAAPHAVVGAAGPAAVVFARMTADG